MQADTQYTRVDGRIKRSKMQEGIRDKCGLTTLRHLSAFTAITIVINLIGHFLLANALVWPLFHWECQRMVRLVQMVSDNVCNIQGRSARLGTVIFCQDNVSKFTARLYHGPLFLSTVVNNVHFIFLYFQIKTLHYPPSTFKRC